MAQVGRSVLVTLDRDRHLRYDFNALADLEAVLGKRMGAFKDVSDISLRDIRAFIWAGLKGDDPALTQEQTGDLIQAALEGGLKLDALAGKMNEALALAGYGGAGKEGAAPASPLPATGSVPPSA